MTHHDGNVKILNKHGHPIATIKGGFLGLALPLLASAIGPILNKILGNGVAHSLHDSHSNTIHPIHKTKTKHGGSIKELASYLVPHIQAHPGIYGQGPINPYEITDIDRPNSANYSHNPLIHGNGTGFGAIGFGTGFGASGGSTGFGTGFGVHHGKKKTKKGGYSVDQYQNQQYSGFDPGYSKAMFPINVA